MSNIKTTVTLPNVTTKYYWGTESNYQCWHSRAAECSSSSDCSSGVCPFGSGSGNCKKCEGKKHCKCYANIRYGFFSGTYPSQTLDDDLNLGGTVTSRATNFSFEVPTDWQITKIKWYDGGIQETTGNGLSTTLKCRNCAGQEFSLQTRLIKVGVVLNCQPPTLSQSGPSGCITDRRPGATSGHLTQYRTLAILPVVTTSVVQSEIRATEVATTSPISCGSSAVIPQMWGAPKFARLQHNIENLWQPL